MSENLQSNVSSTEEVKAFVTAAHFSLDKVKQILAEQPDLLNVAYLWQEGDAETAIQAAAHMGSVEIAEYLLEHGAPLEIYTAAMLGRVDGVRLMLADDPANAKRRGAHSIPLMTHVALGGNLEIAELVLSSGGNEGISFALHGAIARCDTDMVRWLLDHGATDLDVRNYQDKTPLEVAVENDCDEIAVLLRERGASRTEQTGTAMP
jgi:ankyrin repeat protein